MANRAHGIDISRWNWTYTPTASPPRPVDFVIQRLGYGMVKDDRTKELAPAVLQTAVRGAYWYVSSAASWIDQCDLFLQLMAGKYDFFAWDVEKAYNGASVADGAVPGMEYLLKQSGKPGLFYTGPDMWGTWLKPFQQDLLAYDMWVAHYWWKPDPSKEPNYWTVRGADTMKRNWKFWQYDPNGQGGRGYEYGVHSKGLDLNVFNGSVEDLWKWAKPDENPEPLPTLACPTCAAPMPPGWSYNNV